MSSALAGLIGTAIGAVAGIAGALISRYMQDRSERKNWARNKKQEAYANTLRYLLRIRNHRSALEPEKWVANTSPLFRPSDVEGQMALRVDEIATRWMNDLVEAQYWITTLTISCAESQRSTISEVGREINESIETLLGSEAIGPFSKPSSLPSKEAQKTTRALSDRLARWYETILSCAR